ncbi:hypothetical protein C0993_006400 [Termitomyces sp. T159_Od127]|nr:hypothetical protein C0993_006400 [Termitomyces sp. T159_Od127]
MSKEAHRFEDNRNRAVNNAAYFTNIRSDAMPNTDHYRAVSVPSDMSSVATHFNGLTLGHLPCKPFPDQNTQASACQDTHHDPEHTDVKVQQPFLRGKY